MLAVEGRRRNIPLLTAFLALAHLVNLSFAQSLFYLALLLTPAPLPTGDEGLELPVAPVPTSRWTSLRDKILPPKPPHWHPHPAVFYSALVLNLGSTLTLPYAAGTSSFLATTLLARGSTFLPLLLPRMAPASWGKVDVHPHARYESLTHIFRFVSAASFLLHLKATFAGLAYNAPASHYHRHSSLLPWDVEERDTWERTNTAVGKVLGSIKDHPAVMAVGLDVLLCALSLGVWAAVRPTSIEGIIKAAVPFHRQAKSAETDKRLLDEISRALSPALTTSEGVEAEAKPRKRGRPRKTPLPEADVKSEQGHGGEDEAYEPTKAEEKQTVEGDRQSTAGAETGQAEDYEAAALAWGISAVAGLASASAGVFGGECMSR